MFVDRDWRRCVRPLVHRRVRRDRHRREADADRRRSGRARRRRSRAEDRRHRPGASRSSAQPAGEPGHAGAISTSAPASRSTRIVSAAPDEIDGRRSTSPPTRPSGRATLFGGRRRERRRGRLRQDRRHQGDCRRPAWRASAAANFPKQFQQFEAVAYSQRSGRQAGHEDDLELGPGRRDVVVEEYTATFDDDDMDVRRARIDAATGLFTPNVDGPNPKRERQPQQLSATSGSSRATAAGGSATPADQGAGAPARHRAALHAWDQPEVRTMIALGRARIPSVRGGRTPFVYLVPSAAIFALDEPSVGGPRRRELAVASEPTTSSRRWRAHSTRPTIRAAIDELLQRAGDRRSTSAPTNRRRAILPLTPFPLTTMVLNVTNQCNLALHLLLRVRRGQDRRHRERPAAEVHERGDGARRASTSC